MGSGSHAVQTAEVMQRFEPVLDEHQADAVLVVGDVNSTIACALVASKTYSGHSCRSGITQLRQSDAGRDKPGADRSNCGPALYH